MADRDVLTRSGVGAALNATQHDRNLNSICGTVEQQTGATYTVVYTDQNKVIEFDNASCTVTVDDMATIMAAIDTDSFTVTLKNINAADLTLVPSGTDTIDGAASCTLTQNECYCLCNGTDGSTWNTLFVKIDEADYLQNITDTATNTSDIATNTSNIATNTSDISTNATAISTLTATLKKFCWYHVYTATGVDFTTTYTASTWNTVQLTEWYDPDNICTVSSGVLTPIAGVYAFKFIHMFKDTAHDNKIRARMRQTSGTPGTIVIGPTYNTNSNGQSMEVQVFGSVVADGATTYEFQVYLTAANQNMTACGDGEAEIWSYLHLEKVG